MQAYSMNVNIGYAQATRENDMIREAGHGHNKDIPRTSKHMIYNFLLVFSFISLLAHVEAFYILIFGQLIFSDYA